MDNNILIWYSCLEPFKLIGQLMYEKVEYNMYLYPQGVEGRVSALWLS